MSTVTNPLISIVIPMYNCSGTLNRCLDSVLAQTYSRLEVLLLDDGSTDDTAVIGRTYEKQDVRFHFHALPHGGISAVRNYGVQAAKGEYLLFIDSDDYVDPDYAETLLRLIREPESGSSSGTVLGIISFRQFSDEEETMEHLEIPEGTCTRKEYLLQMSSWPGAHYYGVLWNKIYRTDRAKAIRFPDETGLGEDFIFNMNYFCRMAPDEKIRVSSCRLYHYYKRQGSLSSGRVPDFAAAKARVMMYDSYRDAWRSAGIDRSRSGRMKLYMLRSWCEESEQWQREGASPEDLKQLYRMYIIGTGTGRLRCAVFSLLRRIVHLVRK